MKVGGSLLELRHKVSKQYRSKTHNAASQNSLGYCYFSLILVLKFRVRLNMPWDSSTMSSVGGAWAGVLLNPANSAENGSLTS